MPRPGKKRVEVYFDLNDYDRLLERVKLTHFNLSDYIRTASLNTKIYTYDMKVLNNLIFEINKIGVNVNQIARKVNEFETINRSDVLTLKEEYDRLCHMLNQFLFEQPLTEV